MTDCAKIAELISAMLDGELTAEEESLVKEHIESCSECAQMYEMFALVSGELQSDLAEAPADLKDKVMAGIKPAKKKKGIIVSLRPYMTAAACLVLVIGIFAAGRGGFGMSAANDAAAPRTAEVNCSASDSAEEPKAQAENYGYIPETAEDSVCEEEAPTECADGAVLDTNGSVSESESEGSIYRGTLVDRAMSKVDERDFTGRAYIGIEFDDGTGQIFWLARGYELPEGIELGDRVEIESEIEKNTGLLIATKVTVIEE